MQNYFKWGKERNLILEGSILPMHGLGKKCGKGNIIMCRLVMTLRLSKRVVVF